MLPVLMCNENLTLIQHIREADSDRYSCVAIQGGSWYRKLAVAISEAGAKPVNTCRSRIPAAALPADVVPKEGDFLVRGSLTSVSKIPADLAGHDFILISSVGDNRRGKFQHWAVSGA